VKYDVAYLWEFNPQLVRAYLRPLEAIDPVVKVVPRPAWGKDENMTFFIDKRCVQGLGFRCLFGMTCVQGLRSRVSGLEVWRPFSSVSRVFGVK
jgi:hypothetical protein